MPRALHFVAATMGDWPVFQSPSVSSSTALRLSVLARTFSIAASMSVPLASLGVAGGAAKLAAVTLPFPASGFQRSGGQFAFNHSARVSTVLFSVAMSRVVMLVDASDKMTTCGG